MSKAVSISADAVDIDGFSIRTQPDLNYLVTLFGPNYRTVDIIPIRGWVWDNLGIYARSTSTWNSRDGGRPTDIAANLGITLFATGKKAYEPTQSYSNPFTVFGVVRTPEEPARAYLRRVFLASQHLGFGPVHPQRAARPGEIFHINGKPRGEHPAIVELCDPDAADNATEHDITITFYFATPVSDKPVATPAAASAIAEPLPSASSSPDASTAPDLKRIAEALEKRNATARQTIGDGFRLWIGRMLAKLFVGSLPFILILALVLGALILWYLLTHK